MEQDSAGEERGSAAFLFRDAQLRLEWESIAAALAREASLSSVRAQLLALTPDFGAEEREWWLEATAEMLHVIASGNGPTLLDLDYQAVAGPLRRRAILPGTSLLQVLRLCETCDGVAAFRKGLSLPNQSIRHPHLFTLLEPLATFFRLRSDLARCLDHDGQVLSTASPELRSARSRAEGARRRMTSIVESLLQRSQVRDALQDAVWSERDGHIVLPVRVERRADVPGIARGMSNTGQTVFIEPQEISAARSELEQALVDVEIEVNRVLRALSEQAHAHVEELDAAFEILSQFDALQARARLASTVGGVRPRFLPPGSRGPRFVLENARHPLFAIEGRECVPSTLHLGPQFDGDEEKFVWVLTGPNAGGKTVAMRSVGIAVLMAKAGLFVAADKAELLDFSHVFVELGDRQSREEDLSTFSGHLLHVKRILTVADESSLVLLDEGFVGTDPAVGMALARSTLEFLAERRVTTIITTHFSNLKLVANENPRFLNACMEFEARRLLPTYRLINGIPGQSFALELASRIGYPASIVEAARGLYGDEAHRMELLLAELQVKRGELDAILAEQDSARRKANEELAALRKDRALMQHQRESLVETFRTRLSRRLNAFENRLVVRERQFEKHRQSQLGVAEAAVAPAPSETAAPPEGPAVSKARSTQGRPSKEPARPAKLSSFSELSQVKVSTLPGARGEAERDASLERRAQEFRAPKQMSVRSLLDEARDSLENLGKSMDEIEGDFRREMSVLMKDTAPEKTSAPKPATPASTPQGRPAAHWKPGMRIKCARFGEVGEVVRAADAKGQVECLFGLIRTRVPHAELRTLDDVARHGLPPASNQAASRPRKSASSEKSERNRVAMEIEPTLQHKGNTVDVRGLTADNAVSAAHDFLDKAWSGGVERIIIVHGHGTGRVKQMVRSWLESCSYALRFRPGVTGEGGDGVTVVEFD